jgi:hypothetical protein
MRRRHCAKRRGEKIYKKKKHTHTTAAAAAASRASRGLAGWLRTEPPSHGAALRPRPRPAGTESCCEIGFAAAITPLPLPVPRPRPNYRIGEEAEGVVASHIPLFLLVFPFVPVHCLAAGNLFFLSPWPDTRQFIVVKVLGRGQAV